MKSNHCQSKKARILKLELNLGSFDFNEDPANVKDDDGEADGDGDGANVEEDVISWKSAE